MASFLPTLQVNKKYLVILAKKSKKTFFKP